MASFRQFFSILSRYSSTYPSCTSRRPVHCSDDACVGLADFFFALSRDGKCAKILTNFLFRFPMMEKSAKDQANGKCSRTSPSPPKTVGPAPARSTMASCVETHRMRLHASSGLRAGQRPAGLDRTSEVAHNSPSLRIDEGASAETKLALAMPSEEEKGVEASNRCPKGKIARAARPCGSTLGGLCVSQRSV